MTAQDVHTIASALPKEEYIRLHEIMSSKIKDVFPKKKQKKKPILTDFEAQEYLIKTVFHHKKS